jgi:hypothetical protein
LIRISLVDLLWVISVFISVDDDSDYVVNDFFDDSVD